MGIIYSSSNPFRLAGGCFLISAHFQTPERSHRKADSYSLSSEAQLNLSPPLFSAHWIWLLLRLLNLLLLLLFPSRYAPPNAIPRPQSASGPSPGRTLLRRRRRTGPRTARPSTRLYTGISRHPRSVVAVRRGVVAFTLPIDVESALLSLMIRRFIRQQQHEHLLPLHLFF